MKFLLIKFPIQLPFKPNASAAFACKLMTFILWLETDFTFYFIPQLVISWKQHSLKSEGANLVVREITVKNNNSKQKAWTHCRWKPTQYTPLCTLTLPWGRAVEVCPLQAHMQSHRALVTNHNQNQMGPTKVCMPHGFQKLWHAQEVTIYIISLWNYSLQAPGLKTEREIWSLGS